MQFEVIFRLLAEGFSCISQARKPCRNSQVGTRRLNIRRGLHAFAIALLYCGSVEGSVKREFPLPQALGKGNLCSPTSLLTGQGRVTMHRTVGILVALLPRGSQEGCHSLGTPLGCVNYARGLIGPWSSPELEGWKGGLNSGNLTLAVQNRAYMNRTWYAT